MVMSKKNIKLEEQNEFLREILESLEDVKNGRVKEFK